MTRTTDKPLSKTKSLLIIALSGLISIFFAVAWVEYGATELGVLIYFFVPIIVTISLLIISSLIELFFSVNRFWLTMTFVIINLITGIFLRFDFYYNIIGW
jgi:hypothetical protein